MERPPLVTVTALARMLGWSRSNVWYWLPRAGVQLQQSELLPWPYIPTDQVDEVLFRLRAARAARRHDGHGGGEARARRSQHQGGVY